MADVSFPDLAAEKNAPSVTIYITRMELSCAAVSMRIMAAVKKSAPVVMAVACSKRC